MAKNQYVAVFGSEEEFGEFDPVVAHNRDNEAAIWSEKKNLCQQLVRRLGLKTSRKEPKTVKVSVFSLHIIKGKLERRGAGNFDIDLPLERMTSDEYNAEMDETLAEIPEEFRSFVRESSYERGHSAGYEQVVSIAHEMVFGLKPCIEAFKRKK